jgi:carboxylesterase
MNKMERMLKSASDTKVRNISRPELLFPADGKGNGKSVLLIHGYTGSPHDMRYLGERLQKQGYLVSIPRLPGHGTCLDDFLETGAEEWLRRSVDSWLELETFDRPQYLAGLSMGGILAVILASSFRPERLVLAAPALMTSNPVLSLTPLLKFFVKKRHKSEVERYEDPDLDYLSREYWSVTTPSSAAELYRLQRLGRKLLSRVSAPTLTIVSENDHSVPAAVGAYIQSGISSEKKEVLTLKESPHVVVNDCEKETVADRIIAWFDQQD